MEWAGNEIAKTSAQGSKEIGVWEERNIELADNEIYSWQAMKYTAGRQ